MTQEEMDEIKAHIKTTVDDALSRLETVISGTTIEMLRPVLTVRAIARKNLDQLPGGRERYESALQEAEHELAELYAGEGGAND